MQQFASFATAQRRGCMHESPVDAVPESCCVFKTRDSVTQIVSQPNQLMPCARVPTDPKENHTSHPYPVSLTPDMPNSARRTISLGWRREPPRLCTHASMQP